MTAAHDGAEPTRPLRASIVVIGDEILDGFVRDSNAGWLAGRLHALGIPLDRIAVVPDQVPAIVEALSAELGRARPRVVFTSGGIGTTPDDRTMAAVADFLKVDLVEEPSLRAMVDGIIERLNGRGHEVDDAQVRAIAKMAQVPSGATTVTDGRTGPPSARIDLDGGVAHQGAAIVVLPGVPYQFRNLVEHLEASLLADLGTPGCTEQLTHPFPESVLTPLLEELETRYPTVRIGSYPGPECTLRVHGAEDDVAQVVAELRTAVAVLVDDPRMQRLADEWRRGWRASQDETSTESTTHGDY